MRTWFLTSLLMAACTDRVPPAPQPEVQPAVQAPVAPPPVADAPPVNYRALVPSPLGVEAAVRAAGVSDGLAHLVPTTVPAAARTDANATAVRTGIVLADAILAGKDTPAALLLERLTVIRSGLEAIGAGAGLLATLDDLRLRVEQGGAGTPELIQELDNVATMMVPEAGWGPTDTTGPLLQAGAWLEGSHLVAKAVRAGNKPEAADQLLREQQVVEYFLGYVRAQGQGKAEDQVLDTLEQVLTSLAAVAGKEHLGPEDVELIEVPTGQVLELL